MNKKDQFVMNLKYKTPAHAIDELLVIIKFHPNIHLQPKGVDRDEIDMFVFCDAVECNDDEYRLPNEQVDWHFWEKQLNDITGIEPAYADYEDENTMYYEFNAPAEFSADWDFIAWVEALEELVQAANMKSEIEEKIAELFIKTKEKNNV